MLIFVVSYGNRSIMPFCSHDILIILNMSSPTRFSGTGARGVANTLQVTIGNISKVQTTETWQEREDFYSVATSVLDGVTV